MKYMYSTSQILKLSLILYIFSVTSLVVGLSGLFLTPLSRMKSVDLVFSHFLIFFLIFIFFSIYFPFFYF